MRIVALNENVGGSEARNIGVQEARGEWIALLDDDDEWLPTKVSKQVEAALLQNGNRIVVTCQYYDRHAGTQLLRPRSFPKAGQRISDFLYGDCSWLGSIEGFPQTSTWLISRALLLEIPFRRGLKRNQDTDWILRALDLPGVQAYLVREPLSIFHNEVNRKRITQSYDWRDSYQWVMHHRALFSAKAFSSFIAIMCMNHAGKAGIQVDVYRDLSKDIEAYGKTTLKTEWLMLLYGFVYPIFRRFLSPRYRKLLTYRLAAPKRSNAKNPSH
jgi:glycosyltransferase involved in cell wall biosynthesis